MGEAKRRGTFEQRKAAAIERDGFTREELKRLKDEQDFQLNERLRSSAKFELWKHLLRQFEQTGVFPFYIG